MEGITARIPAGSRSPVEVVVSVRVDSHASCVVASTAVLSPKTCLEKDHHPNLITHRDSTVKALSLVSLLVPSLVRKVEIQTY